MAWEHIMPVGALVLLACHVHSAEAQLTEPGWGGPVFARGAERAAIEATPILERNYRPLHFYGNTVRRRYYRGTAIPAPRDVMQGPATLLWGMPSSSTTE